MTDHPDALAATPTPIPVPAPSGWSVAAPGSAGGKVTARANLIPPGDTIGLNVPSGGAQVFSDYLINGTYDSAVLVGPAAAGTTFQRFKIINGGSLGAGPNYGRHGFYLKGQNITCEDCDVQCDPTVANAGQGFSVRDAGFTARRFRLSALFAIGFFEDDATPGKMMFVEGRGTSFHPDCSIYCDSPVAHELTFQNVAMEGVDGSLFFRGRTFAGSLTLIGCTNHRRPVTAADVLAPLAKVTIQ